jgi:hypothetical protein
MRQSDKHEKKLIEEMGESMGEQGRRCPASGALKWWKGDGFFTDRYRIELKETSKDYHLVKLDVLKTVESQKQGMEEPILVLLFNPRHGDDGEKFVIRKGCPWSYPRLPPTVHHAYTAEKQIRLAVEVLREPYVSIVFSQPLPEGKVQEVVYYVTKWDDFLKEIENDRED